jgi:tRNA(Ile)-lysidine synthase
MLVALAAIRDGSPGYQLRCIHVEHGIRPAEESGGDAEFTRSLCEKLRVPCRIVSVPPGKIEAAAKSRGTGIEAAARHFRRRILFREARCVEAETGRPVLILTAHTKDDMLETVLMRILRGSGPAGLSALPSRRGRFFRPKLELSRRDVLAYLTEKNIHFCSGVSTVTVNPYGVSIYSDPIKIKVW